MQEHCQRPRRHVGAVGLDISHETLIVLLIFITPSSYRWLKNGAKVLPAEVVGWEDEIEGIGEIADLQ